MTQPPEVVTGPLHPNLPPMLAPILRTPDGVGPSITADEVIATIRLAATNAATVMPPLAAAFFHRKLNDVADTAEGGGQIAWFVVNQWLDHIDEINALTAAASREYEIRTPDGHTMHRDDIGDAVDWQRQVWPDATIHRRTRVSIYSEWTEVTE